LKGFTKDNKFRPTGRTSGLSSSQLGINDERKAKFAKQKWKIGFVLPNVSNEHAEEIHQEVIKAMYAITNKHPELKNWKGFKAHDDGKHNDGFIGSGSVL